MPLQCNVYLFTREHIWEAAVGVSIFRMREPLLFPTPFQYWFRSSERPIDQFSNFGLQFHTRRVLCIADEGYNSKLGHRRIYYRSFEKWCHSRSATWGHLSNYTLETVTNYLMVNHHEFTPEKLWWCHTWEITLKLCKGNYSQIAQERQLWNWSRVKSAPVVRGRGGSICNDIRWPCIRLRIS